VPKRPAFSFREVTVEIAHE